MEITLLEKCFLLKDLIHETNEYKELIASEGKMSNSDEVKVLSYRKDIAIMEYEDSLKLGKEFSSIAIESKKKLSEAIYKLNNHPLVVDYKNKLENLNNLYKEIDDLIFGEFNVKNR